MQDGFILSIYALDSKDAHCAFKLNKRSTKRFQKNAKPKNCMNPASKDGVFHYILETSYFDFMNSYVGGTFYIKSLT